MDEIALLSSEPARGRLRDICEDHPVTALPTDARRALLGRLVDHAPRCPPARLELSAAVAEDERARRSRHPLVLARYVCPASSLAELPDVGRGVSIVLDAPLAPDPRAGAVATRYAEPLEELGSSGIWSS